MSITDGPEQLTIITKQDGRLIREQKIFDPFLHSRTVIAMSRWDLFKALFRKQFVTEIQVEIRGTEGVQRAWFMLDAKALEAETAAILEDRRLHRYDLAQGIGLTAAPPPAQSGKENEMNEWVSTAESLPPEGEVVDTKIDNEDGCRNEQPLMRQKSLWFFADGSMYVYYHPTHLEAARRPEQDAGGTHVSRFLFFANWICIGIAIGSGHVWFIPLNVLAIWSLWPSAARQTEQPRERGK
jgi:hypothetical protein